MHIADNNCLLLSDTLVPDLFIYNYMMKLSKEAISIYLLIVSGSKNELSQDDILELSCFDKDRTMTAISELIATSLLTKNKDGRFILVDIKKNEVNAYCTDVINRGGVDLEGLKLSPLKKERDELAEGINKNCYAGNMGYVFYKLIDKCLNEYGFDTLVIYTLFNMATEKCIQYDAKEVEKMAKQWYDDGIRSSENLDKELERIQKVNDLIKVVGKITRKRVNEYDIERISKWVSLAIDQNLIEYAFRCNSYRDSLRTKDVDDTLSIWLEMGIKNVDDATKFESEKQKENKRKYTKRKNSDSNFKTGKDVGLTITQPETTAQEKSESSSTTSGDDSAIDDILNLFGDFSDENN